jgi:signal transduction histidine kinase
MRNIIKLLLVKILIFLCITIWTQEVIEINRESFGVNFAEFQLSNMDGWIYKSGNDIQWANTNIDTRGWERLKPTELTVNHANDNGRLEGWFRVKIRIDTSLSNTPLYVNKRSRDAVEFYLNGELKESFGKIDDTRESYNAFIDNTLLPPPFLMVPDSIYTIALHTLDYTAMYPKRLRGQMSGPHAFFDLGTQRYFNERESDQKYSPIFKTIYLTASLLLNLLFWVLVILNPLEKNIKVIAICTTLSMLSSVGMILLDLGGITFNQWRISAGFSYAAMFAYLSYIPRAISQIFTGGIGKTVNYATGVFLLIGFINVFVIWKIEPMIVVAGGSFLLIFHLLISYWKKLHGAQWAIVVGIILTVIFVGLLLLLVFFKQHLKYDISFHVLNAATACFFLTLPVSLLIYVAIRFKEIIEEVSINANQVIKIAEEKKELLATQNLILEKKVSDRTSELSKSLENLKSTQTQLIQSEKMASLGELTAGIAHEIQNPLNFVNNFSEVSYEMIEEANEEMEKGEVEEVKYILEELKGNLEKINHHGKRADSIVKGMLLHSRTSKGEKVPTDINALCDEFLRLSYHGLRAKDRTFNADFEMDFDESLPKIEVIPQDIGRVLLNLFNNAFCAASDEALLARHNHSEDKAKLDSNNKAKSSKPLTGLEEGEGGIESLSTSEENKIRRTALSGVVKVHTKNLGANIEITVSDNGPGIPDEIKDKIFQPFFTTKPTGQGTGLGLSLAYDIVKAHGGEIKVESVEGKGTEFKIKIPVS